MHLRSKEITGITSKASYQKVVDTYYRTMVMFASKYIKDVDDAKDVVQDSFIALWDNRINIKSEACIKSYLYSTVRNKSLNFLRDSRPGNGEDELIQLQSEDNLSKAIIKEETLRLFYQALDELNENAKKVILLTLEGYAREEIAEKLSIGIDAVKYHKKQSVIKLRKQLQHHYYILTFLM